MSLTETYRRVRIGKNVSNRFPIRNGLKQGDGLSPVLFNFALESVYTPAMARSEDHEVHKYMWWHWGWIS